MILNSYRKKLAFKFVFILILLAILFLLFFYSINVGSSSMSFVDSLNAILGKGNEKYAHIIFNIRLPRLLGAIVVGMSIALSGMIIQSSMNNPLASPSTLGISSASALGANICIVLFAKLGLEPTMSMTGFASFLAAMLCMILVLAISKLNRADKTLVILSGVAFNALFSAIITMLQYFADDRTLASAVSWTFGDLGRIDYNEVLIVFLVLMFSSFVMYLLRWKINAMDMGEATAHSLGVNVKRMRNISIFIASLNAGLTVAFVGMIGFVGLLAPQITKRVVGEDKRFMMPSTMLLGAVIVVFCDTVARTVAAPLILPVGAVTSLFGAPLFVYILLKER